MVSRRVNASSFYPHRYTPYVLHLNISFRILNSPLNCASFEMQIGIDAQTEAVARDDTKWAQCKILLEVHKM